MPKAKAKAREADPVVFVLDTETTGFEEPVIPIQIAAVRLAGRVPHEAVMVSEDFINERFNPGRPIEYGAMSAHGIRPEALKDAPTWGRYKFPVKPHYLIGHSVAFDLGVIKDVLPKGSDPKLICTNAISNVVFEECDSHKLTALAHYVYDKNLVPYRAEWLQLIAGAHEAVSDIKMAYYLMVIMAELLQVKSWAEFHDLSVQCSTPTIMPFGKHKDERIADMPDSYKGWALGPKGMTDLDPGLTRAFQMRKEEWEAHFTMVAAIKARIAR